MVIFVLGSALYYATSDLGKVLGKFNSVIKGRKLVVMNETGMASGEWHKFNDHLKALISENKVSIEHKGVDSVDLKDYTAFMVTSNHDTPLKVDIGDGRIVCLDASSRCRGNRAYFKNLGKVFNHPDAPGVVMRYLLNRNLSNWDPEDIPVTKMKTETIRDQLPNSIRFVIELISSWVENQTEKTICANLYQNYLTWCGSNGENSFTSKKFGKTLPVIGIERKQVRINGKREWIYILDRFKIVAKLHESIGDIEEFSDSPQAEISTNTPTDIPIFDAPKIATPAPPITNMTQDLFDSIKNESSVALSSKSTDISPSPEIMNVVEPVDDKSEPSSEIIESMNDDLDLSKDSVPEPSPSLHVNESESNNEVIPQQISYPPGYQTREQREKRLRQWATDHNEDPDKFMTITEEDINLSRTYRDRMMADADMIQFAKDNDDDPNSLMDMTRRERLISEEIMIRLHEDKNNPQPRSYNDDEWIEKISILQENEYLW
ncbi:4700_t:CDS:2 [Entrophospora sp. SA101]|nr:4700_t:CDS:2 [Entrophospora sp. SA101]